VVGDLDSAVHNLQGTGTSALTSAVQGDSNILADGLGTSSETVPHILTSGNTSDLVVVDSVFDLWLNVPF
jgi:hypothetical protein